MAAPESCGHRGDHRASWLLCLPAAFRGKEGERRVTSKACYFCTCILAFKPLILSNFQLERMACTYAFISAPSSNPPKIGLEEPKGNNQDLQENRRGGDSRRAQEGGWRLQEVGSDLVARAGHRRQSRPGATTGDQARSSGCRRPPPLNQCQVIFQVPSLTPRGQVLALPQPWKESGRYSGEFESETIQMVGGVRGGTRQRPEMRGPDLKTGQLCESRHSEW